MKTFSTTAIAALMTATLGLSAVAPAMAQPVAPQDHSQPVKPGEHGKFRPGHQGHHGQPGPRRGNEFGGLFGFERGAENIEVAIVRLSHRLDLTDEQKALLETMKTDALAAAEEFKTAIDALRPTKPAEGEKFERPSIADRLDMRIAFDKARLAALEAVQPSVKAFFDSLTEEQTAKLGPQRDRFGGPGHGDRPGPRPAPQRPAPDGAAQPAPADAPAAPQG